MNNITLEELEYDKAIMRIALLKGRIDQEFYEAALVHFEAIEYDLLKNERLKALKMNKLKSKLNLLVTN